MPDLSDELGRLISEQDLEVRCEGENVWIEGPARAAVIPTGSVPPDGLTDTQLLIRALTAITIYNDCEDFLDWCDEFGYPAGAPGRLDEFKAIGTGLANLQALVGADRVSELCMALRIGQAIHMARPR
ncbi:hypothetical protein [Hyphobacterium indicum]|uniref:hypothetical protein n=1 Tax=Hyphobacterium indicum TaxID=2162714 RepID=UPI000D65A3FB|nr:hypothetical protein [Hyphobacterium indicum]